MINRTTVQFTLFLFMLTSVACTPGESDAPQTSSAANEPAKKILIVGGGDSHDFDRWFNEEDTATLEAAGFDVAYTDDPSTVASRLKDIDLLYLSNNQPMTDPLLREFIFDYADTGNPLLLVHPALWYNWEDWPEYNRELAGGGSRSHGPYGAFDITVTNTNHPLVNGLPPTFTLEDELYRFEVDAEGSPLNVIMVGTEPDTGNQYPVVWAVDHSIRRIVGITLGHDGYTHQSDEYKTLLTNAALWLAK